MSSLLSTKTLSLHGGKNECKYHNSFFFFFFSKWSIFVNIVVRGGGSEQEQYYLALNQSVYSIQITAELFCVHVKSLSVHYQFLLTSTTERSCQWVWHRSYIAECSGLFSKLMPTDENTHVCFKTGFVVDSFL